MRKGKIIICTWKDVPKKMQDYLLEHLTIGEGSGMQDSLCHNLMGGGNTPTYIATYKNKPIGWAILAQRYHYDWLMVYVKPEYRRKGIGGALASEVKRHKKRANFYCAKWNHTAAAFFKKNIKLYKYQRYNNWYDMV